jgi:hypothetical protein
MSDKEKYQQILVFIENKGRAYYDDIMQLYNLGIPVYRLVSECYTVEEHELKREKFFITKEILETSVKKSFHGKIFY